MSYSKEELVAYRLEKARESYADARLLYSDGRWNAAANRMYYSCFYVISAYLVASDKKAVTHAGLKASFNKELVKTGRISRDDGKLFNNLFLIRQRADYEDFSDMTREDLEPLLQRIKGLINHMEEIIKGIEGQ